MSIPVSNMQWTGNPRDIDSPGFRRFMVPGLTATPRLIWWLEPDLAGVVDLLFTVEGSDADPIRVRPGEWLHEFGGHYRRGGAAVTAEQPRRMFLTSAEQSWLADLKTRILDPALRELGLDPDRYGLAHELSEPFPVPAARPLTDQQELARAMALQTIARGLDIPQEILETPPPTRRGTWRRAGPMVEMDDPYNIGAFEHTRSRYMPRWRYVSGGKALHAFIGGSDRPACGIDPRRGPDRQPARWVDSTDQGSKRYGDRRRGEHGPCTKAVRAHRDAMLRGEV